MTMRTWEEQFENRTCPGILWPPEKIWGDMLLVTSLQGTLVGEGAHLCCVAAQGGVVGAR